MIEASLGKGNCAGFFGQPRNMGTQKITEPIKKYMFFMEAISYARRKEVLFLRNYFLGCPPSLYVNLILFDTQG